MDEDGVPTLYKLKPKRGEAPTTSDLHAQQVLKDSQFQQRVLEIRTTYAKKYRISLPQDLQKLQELYAQPGNLYVHLLKDEGTHEQRLFLDWESLTDEAIRESIITLSNDYAIDVWWILECINDPRTIPYFFNRKMIRSRVIVEEDKKSLYIRIWPNTQLDDIIAEWDDIEDAKKASYMKYDSKQNGYVRYKSIKNKAPEDPELIYAIFRAKREDRTLTYPQIFRLYQDGKLPRYDNKPTNQFSSSKTLENYYRKYKPTT